MHIYIGYMQGQQVLLVQGCVEILYVTFQMLVYVVVVYWMCWFQIDAGTSVKLHALHLSATPGPCSTF